MAGDQEETAQLLRFLQERKARDYYLKVAIMLPKK